MPHDGKKLIFWFEDASEVFEAYLQELEGKYEIMIGAHPRRIKQKRDEHPVDLVIIDLMIHPRGYDYKTKKEVVNLHFKGIHWKHTGLEFLRLIREGEYKQWGFDAKIPIIVLTAIIDAEIEVEARKLNVDEYLGKPYPLSKLEKAIEKALKNISNI